MDHYIFEFGHVCYGCQSKIANTVANTFANSVDPDETAHNEPSHLDLHCLIQAFTLVCRTEKVISLSNRCFKLRVIVSLTVVEALELGKSRILGLILSKAHSEFKTIFYSESVFWTEWKKKKKKKKKKNCNHCPNCICSVWCLMNTLGGPSDVQFVSFIASTQKITKWVISKLESDVARKV